MNEDLLTAGGQEIFFSGSTLLGYFVTGTLYILLPVLAFFLMKKYGAARIYHVIVGAVVYFLATRLCDLCAHMIGGSQSFAMKAVIAAELVCIAEEVGRWLAVKYPVADIRTTRAAMCYGIGHGGLECWIRGFDSFKVFRMGLRCNSRGSGSFSAGKSAELAEQITGQLRESAAHPLFLSILEQISLIGTFSVQIALSLLIYKKYRENSREIRWLLAAVGLHYFLNAAVWLASLSQNRPLCVLVSIACDAAVAAVVFRIISFRECADEVLFSMEE